jgi:hypothetical protein
MMIAMLMGSALYMVAAQASMAAPINAFKDCLKQTSAKAKSEKVAAANYEAYARNACGAQLTALTNSIVAFNMKNGMSKKTAASDAELTAADYLASSVDKYGYLAGVEAENAKVEAAANAPKPAAPAATPTPTPASAPKPQ